MTKPDFKDLRLDLDFICWGMGNKAASLTLIASIKLRELDEEEKAEYQMKYDAAKEIYDKFINKGQKFKPAGKSANHSVEAKITFIHTEKQSVTWKQTNIPEGFKGASGKWSINTLLALVRGGEIVFLE